MSGIPPAIPQSSTPAATKKTSYSRRASGVATQPRGLTAMLGRSRWRFVEQQNRVNAVAAPRQIPAGEQWQTTNA
jgi:hypothetical protein